MKKIRIDFFVYACFFALIIPLLIVVFALFYYTVHQNSEKYAEHMNSVAVSVASSAERQIKISMGYLREVTVSMEHLAFGYALKRDRLFVYASTLDQDLSKAFSNVQISKGFLYYNSYTDYMYTNYHGTLSSTVLKELRSRLKGRVYKQESCFMSLPSLDPSCYLLIIRHQYGSIISVLDLSQDSLFRASEKDFEGMLYFGQNHLDTQDFCEVPINVIPVSLYYKLPKKNDLLQIDQTQIVLLIIIVILVCLTPTIWLIFYRQFLRPLQSLTEAFSIVSKGDHSYRIKETGIIKDLEVYCSGFNKMMNEIEEEKASSLQWQRKSYHQQMDVMQAQLQYLQLQARPHFYLNCLKNVDSLLKLERFDEAHELVLSLSVYIRHIFRDIRSLISLRDELHAVEKYIDLCKLLSRNTSLFLNLDNDCLACKVLPMSILTFVENCIKHGSADDDLEISISATLVHQNRKSFLSIVIENDGGPFELEVLEHLNGLDPSKVEYHNEHVGISNVRYRLWLVFREQAKLTFRNDDCRAVVEMLLPYEMEDVNHEPDDCG